MTAYKVVGKYKPKEEQDCWCRGKPNTQVKKRVYISEEDFNKFSPKLIKRWESLYVVEIYKRNGDKWEFVS